MGYTLIFASAVLTCVKEDLLLLRQMGYFVYNKNNT